MRLGTLPAPNSRDGRARHMCSVFGPNPPVNRTGRLQTALAGSIGAGRSGGGLPETWASNTLDVAKEDSTIIRRGKHVHVGTSIERT